MYAQSIVEYGAAESLMAKILAFAYSVEDWLSDVSPTTWILLCLIAIMGLVYRIRRPRV